MIEFKSDCKNENKKCKNIKKIAKNHQIFENKKESLNKFDKKDENEEKIPFISSSFFLSFALISVLFYCSKFQSSQISELVKNFLNYF